jgi:FAD synthase
MRRAADAEALVAKGLQALAQCDTATANYSFGRVAAVGIEMENADSTAGDPLFYQGVALVGLRDTVNAAWFAAEAIRLDRERHISARPAHAALLQRVSSVASKKC